MYEPKNPPNLSGTIGPTNPSSPTGTPKVSPAAVPWLVGLMVGAVAGLEVCASAAPSPGAQLGCRIAAVALAGVLGVVSPGWRTK